MSKNLCTKSVVTCSLGSAVVVEVVAAAAAVDVEGGFIHGGGLGRSSKLINSHGCVERAGNREGGLFIGEWGG